MIPNKVKIHFNTAIFLFRYIFIYKNDSNKIKIKLFQYIVDC